MISHPELDTLFKSAPFFAEFGFRLESVAAGSCTLHCPFNAKFIRPDGIVSGPVLMAAADAAMWGAIRSVLGADGAATVTTEMKTNFLTAVKEGEDFWCTAKVVKTGRRLIFGTAECVSKEGRLLAHHSLSYIRLEAK